MNPTTMVRERRKRKMAENQQPEKEVLPKLGFAGTNPEGRDAAEAVLNSNLPGADEGVQDVTEMPEPRYGDKPRAEASTTPVQALGLFSNNNAALKASPASIRRLPERDRKVWEARQEEAIKQRAGKDQLALATHERKLAQLQEATEAATSGNDDAVKEIEQDAQAGEQRFTTEAENAAAGKAPEEQETAPITVTQKLAEKQDAKKPRPSIRAENS
jgi:hypothetical protein